MILREGLLQQAGEKGVGSRAVNHPDAPKRRTT
jgi:hypothetical protein